MPGATRTGRSRSGNTRVIVANDVGLYVLTHTTDYLDEALESVMSQTVQVGDRVVVDNGSPGDGVASIAAAHGIPVLRLDRAVAPATARNIACERLEDSTYIVNLDGDDLLLESYIEAYRSAAAESGADIVFGAAELFGAEEGVEFNVAKLGRAPDLRRGNFVPMNSMFSRAIWRSAGGFDPSIGLYDDYDFWLSCASVGGEFAHVDDCHWRYRRHELSRMTLPADQERSASRAAIRRKHRRFINGAFGWRRVQRGVSRVRSGGSVRG